MIHSFDTEIANELGINSAVIYQNILFWCSKNKANNSQFFDGNYWTYNSIKAWKELFPYLGEKQIRTALKKLEESGYIKSGEYNKNKYDRTKWYAITELSKRANGLIQKGEPIPDNKHNMLEIQDLQAFEKLWKDYTLTFLKRKNRGGGSKAKAKANYLKLVSKYSSDEIYDFVEDHAGLEIGHKDLERLLRIENIRQWHEDRIQEIA